MNLKRVSKKAIAEEYTLFNDVASIFRLRMTDVWVLKYKDLVEKKTIKLSLKPNNFDDALREALSILRVLQSFNAIKDLEDNFLLIELIDNYLIYQNERVLNSEISLSRLKVIEIQLRKHLLNFIGGGNKSIGCISVVNNIDGNQFNDYAIFRLKNYENVSSVTIKNELNCFKSFFSWFSSFFGFNLFFRFCFFWLFRMFPF